MHSSVVFFCDQNHGQTQHWVCTQNLLARICHCQISCGILYDHMCSPLLPRGQYAQRKTWRDRRHEPRTVAAALLCRVQQLQTVRAIKGGEFYKLVDVTPSTYIYFITTKLN